MRIIKMIFLSLLIQSCLEATSVSKDNLGKGWIPVYKNDAYGQMLSGKKKDLFAAARNGHPIKVILEGMYADSIMSIEHIANIDFMTILNDEDLYIQIDQITDLQTLLTNVNGEEDNSVMIISTRGIPQMISEYSGDKKSDFRMEVNWYIRYTEKTAKWEMGGLE